MSYNGSGTFNINTTGQPVVAGTVISSSAFNALTTDLATGLTTAITKDGQTTTTARITFAQGITSSLVTDSSSTSTGSIITGGGVGIAKALFVGTTANVAGAVTLGGIATFSAQPIFSSLTASSAVATDASKGLVSVTNTGTGNNVLATSPTIATPTITGDATISGLTVGKGAGSQSLNTAVGNGALAANTTGNLNTAVGFQALQTGTTAAYSVAVGLQALQLTTTGQNNTAIGTNALLNNTTASNGTAVGYQAGYANTTGTSNTFYGYQAGNNLTTGAYGLYVGFGSQASGTGAVAEMVICTTGSTVVGKGNTTGFINANGGGCYQGNNSATWSITSDQRLKKNIVDNTQGLNVVSQIRVRNFEYRTAEEVTELPAHTVIDKQGVQLGVIAQELQEVCGDCVKTESTGVMSVNQDNITWHMVNAIKDLKALNDSLTARITALENA